VSERVPILVERDNVNDEFITLVRWFVPNGERVEAETLVAEVETSKANLEVHAEKPGYLHWAAAEGAEVAVFSPIGYLCEHPIDVSMPVLAAPRIPMPARPARAVSWATEKRPAETGPSFSTATLPQRFSRLAEKMMQTHGLTTADFAGKTLIRKQDVLDRLNPAVVGAVAPAFAPTPQKGSRITQPYVEIPISKMKRAEGAALAAGQRNSVSSSVSVLCFTRGLRKNLQKYPVETGNLSAVIVYEAARLLRKYPALNAAYQAGVMLQYEQVNVGFALDDGRGLKVVVIPRTDEQSLRHVADELMQMTIAYISDKLSPAQMSNVTFTVSDLSGFGVAEAYPVISENQSAILAVGAEQFAPGAVHGTYTMTLAFDHQLADGRTAGRFLSDLKKRLQTYEAATVTALEAIL
jgi:pyruvate/2-oxoglutarate dehydrogenase complex dihydrolipoamide acyltransferase (E2) component